MQKKWIFLIGILLCLAVAAVVYYNYQKPRTGVGGKSAAYSISAEALYNAFITNEAAADQQYTGKVLQVKGAVMEVQKSETSVLVILKGAESGGGVSCLFTNTKEKDWPAVGSEVNVKGRCSGFLMDVNLVDAEIIN
jgi:hypothetical protein